MTYFCLMDMPVLIPPFYYFFRYFKLTIFPIIVCRDMSFISVPGGPGPVVCADTAIYRPGVHYETSTSVVPENPTHKPDVTNSKSFYDSSWPISGSRLHSPKFSEHAAKVKYEHQPVTTEDYKFSQEHMYPSSYNGTTKPIPELYPKHFTPPTTSTVTSPTLCAKENGRSLPSVNDVSSRGDTVTMQRSPIDAGTSSHYRVPSHDVSHPHSNIPNGYKPEGITYDPAKSNYSYHNQAAHATQSHSAQQQTDSLYLNPGKLM